MVNKMMDGYNTVHCLVCGKLFGKVYYDAKKSTWDTTEIYPVCKDCFERAGLKVKEDLEKP